MIEFSLYLSFFAVSILLFLPSMWAKQASSGTHFTITSYRIFFTYNIALMIINIGISRTGNIPLTNIEDAPFVDFFSFIMALVYGYMMATLSKPTQYTEPKLTFYVARNGTRKSLTLNIDLIMYYLRVSILVFGGALFYTTVFNYILSEFITLKPEHWRLMGYVTYPICVLLGIWGVRMHHRKHGRTL